MSYSTSIEIKELKLSIPKYHFPLKSDVIIGHEFPEFKYQDDECSYNTHPFESDDNNNDYVLSLKDFNCIDTNSWFDEIESLVQQYKGTLIADLVGEDSEVDYLRIRDGVKKNVKIVEED